jgi:class 3 adenylate cyclase/tetratricopeptide (TPR) repeat protein
VVAVSRRVQTLLFTDIVGSTGRLRELGDAAWAALLARHHEVIRAVLAAHGGREVDTAGDGFLARFEAPAAAVRAAAAAAAGVAPLGIEIRAGLHTGEVELDGNQIAGVGVHVAARVMARAGPGQVLVSGTVRELLAGSGLGFVDLGVRQLKGFAGRWRLFALDLATVPGDGQAEAVGWGPLAEGRGGTGVPFSGLLSVARSTFVGRVEELQVLEAARRRAADGEPVVVLMGGEAGVGKTRLVAELTARCATDGTRVLVGGCVPVGEGTLPYAPIVEALRALVAEVGVNEVRGLVGPSWPELARLLPALGEPQDDPPGQAAQARLFELLLGLLGRLGEQARLVLVVEDLHWADGSTRSLLSFLVRNIRWERVLMVVTYRSDEPGQQRLGPYLAELDRGGPVQRLELARLDRTETTAQLTGILGAAPAVDLVDDVFARSEGNPFFTEELLAMMRAGSDELPATLRDLLRGRTQALPEPAREVLAVVAVAGRQVPHRLLAAVAGVNDQMLVEALRDGVVSQLLVTRAGQDGYDVRHALIREVVDADLLPGERARLHAALAHAVADLLGSGELDWSGSTAEVAVHWYQAGNLPKALAWSIRAGAAADSSYAYAEAVHHYGRALELWDRVTDAEARADIDRVELLQRAARVANASGDVARAVALIDSALGEVDPTVDPVSAGLLHERRGVYLMTTQDLQARFEALREAVRLIPPDPPSRERAGVLASFAEALVFASRIEEARVAGEEAVAIARQLGADLELGRALVALGGAQADSGALQAAIVSFREASRLAEQHADLDTLGHAWGWLGDALLQAGRLEETVALSLSGRETLRRLGLAGQWQDTLLVVLAAKALFKLGQWDQAHGLAMAAFAKAQPEDSHVFLTIAGMEIGRGNFRAAEARLETSKERSLSLAGIPAHARQHAALLAELRVWQGRLEEARTAIQDGLERVVETDERHNSGLLLCLGMRVAADQAELGRARHTDGEVQAAVAAAHALASQAAAMTPNPLVPGASRVVTTPAVAALFNAERTRLEGRSDPVLWQLAAAAWLDLRRPYPAAYSQWRQAEALLASRAPQAQAEKPLRAAHTVAVRLGAAPLRRELELLAQRGRIQLQAPAEPAVAKPQAPSVAAPLGLTPQEGVPGWAADQP